MASENGESQDVDLVTACSDRDPGPITLDLWEPRGPRILAAQLAEREDRKKAIAVGSKTEGTPPARHVPEKRAAQAAWKGRVDTLMEIIGDTERAKQKTYRLQWQQQVIDSIHDFLATETANETKREFMDRTSEIAAKGKAGVESALRGAMYLHSRRDTIRNDQLR